MECQKHETSRFPDAVRAGWHRRVRSSGRGSGLRPAPGTARPTRRSASRASGWAARGTATPTTRAATARSSASATSTPTPWTRWAQKYPKAKKYYDYRKMLEELGDKIDAVTVSTPDHTHAPASVMAMRMGKHCFCQKPLTWSIEEARVMRTLAAEKKLCTQMGNQGTAEGGFRSGVELIRSGILGPIKEIHVWTNRPIWPQGLSRFKETPRRPQPRALVRVPGRRTRPSLPSRLPAVQVARLARFRHRRPGRHGLPHDQHRLHGPRAVRSRERRGHRHLRHRRPRDLSRLVDHPHPLRRRGTAAARSA